MILAGFFSKPRSWNLPIIDILEAFIIWPSHFRSWVSNSWRVSFIKGTSKTCPFGESPGTGLETTALCPWDALSQWCPILLLQGQSRSSGLVESVLGQIGAKLCRTLALQEQDCAPQSIDLQRSVITLVGSCQNWSLWDRERKRREFWDMIIGLTGYISVCPVFRHSEEVFDCIRVQISLLLVSLWLCTSTSSRQTAVDGEGNRYMCVWECVKGLEHHQTVKLPHSGQDNALLFVFCCILLRGFFFLFWFYGGFLLFIDKPPPSSALYPPVRPIWA